ncbi:MAG: Glutathione peroxidase [Actinomycetota bacterium]|jgi:glutathione peroxidase-family protein
MTNLYDLTMTSITGDPVQLGDFRGKVLLVVNVASA